MKAFRGWLALLLALLLSLGCVAASVAQATDTPFETLEKGDQGDAVLRMKQRLYELGYFRTDDLSDKFNNSTVKALQAFQSVNGLTQDGKLTLETSELLYSASALSSVALEPTPTPLPTVAALATPPPAPEIDYPARDSDGYLAGDGEFVYENDEAGYWVYVTRSLQIVVRLCSDTSVPLLWYETDIRLRGDEKLMTAETNPERPGTRFSYPFDIATNNRFVLGFTDDFYGHRMARKQKVGIVIREGKVLSDRTYSKQLHSLPNLDLLAQFADGSLKAYGCAEITAEELIAANAINVFCFGPVLVKDGEINPLVLAKWYETKSPRQALGMIEPGHYLLLTVQGRMKESAGTGLLRMAYMLRERGVTEALNLDGGNTMALIFRGRMLNKLATWQNKKFVRTVTSLIGVGVSDGVTSVADEK